MWRRRPCHRPPPGRQRGSIVIAAAVAVGVCIALMASADIGYLFYIKREFQKAADLGALAGAQRLVPSNCAVATSAGSSIALANLTRHNFGQAPTAAVNCGVWSTTGPAAAANSPGGQYFIAGTSGNFNGVQVVVSGSAPALMPFVENRSIRASAVAVREQATATISTASQLAALRLAGLDASVLGPSTATVTLSGLLGKLGIPVDADIGIGGLNSLLAVNNVTLGRLLTATGQLLPNTHAALSAQITALNQSVQTSATLKDVTVRLGGANSPVSLFTGIGAATTQNSASLARAALQTEVKVLDLVSAALGVAATANAVAVPKLTLGGIQIRAGVVSPASVATGTVGAIARQAQIRLAIDIDTEAMPLIGPIAGALKTRVRLPLFIDVSRGDARINALSCEAAPPNGPTVDVLVNSTILGACVGKVAESAKFTSAGLCSAATPGDLQPETLLRLLGTDLLTTSIRIDAMSSTKLLAGMKAGETRKTPNDLPVGSALANITSALTSTLAKLTAPPANAGGTPAQVAQNTANAFLAHAPRDGFGRYQIDPLIDLLQNGKPGVLPALGTWSTNSAGAKFQVPHGCGVNNLGRCYRDGTVWESFKATVTGEGTGLIGGALGTVLGGLAVNNCFGLLSNLLNYNNCVANNLASYLQSKPDGTVAPTPTVTACDTLLCTLLKPVTDGVAPILNAVGSSLAGTLSSILGLTLGETSVTVNDINCGNVRLVY